MKEYLKGCVLLSFLLILGCGGMRSTVDVDQLAADSLRIARATDHYLSGALLDFREQYKAAIHEYHRALTYDSSSAQILKAIGRDHLRLDQYKAAVRYLKRSYANNPEDRETLFYLADAYYSLDDSEKTIASFEKLNKVDPYNTAVHANLIYLYSRGGQLDRLVRLREDIVQRFGYRDDSVYQLFSLYMQMKAYQKAENLADTLLALDNGFARNWALLGSARQALKDTSGAMAAYRKVMRLHPPTDNTIVRMYHLLADGKEWETAVEVLTPLIDQPQVKDKARHFLTESLMELGRFDEAEEVVSPLLNRAGFKAKAHHLMGMISLGQGQQEKALNHLRRFTGLEPWNTEAWEGLALTYLQDEDYQNAILVLEEALVEKLESPRLLSLYGTSLARVERKEEALVVLRKAYSFEPKDINTIMALSTIYEDLGRYQDLDSLYETALIVYPGNPLLLNNYSYSLAQRGKDLQKALQMAAEALKFDPKSAAFLDTKGWVYFKLGEYDKAQEYIGKAASKSDDDPVISDHLGDVYFQLGDVEAARRNWQKALEADPENEAIQRKLQTK